MRKFIRNVFCFAIPLVFLSCGERDPDADADKDRNNSNNGNSSNSLSNQILAGKIDGATYTFQSGFATKNNQGWQVYLYSEANNDPCDMFKRHGSLYIGFQSTLQTGQSNQTISLGSGADTSRPHINVVQGNIIIDQVSDTNATGRMTATYNDQSAVQGSFTVKKCSGTAIR